MKYIINDEVVLSRAPEGPLIVWLDRFASFASSKGYVRASIHRQVLLAAGFSQWQAGHCPSVAPYHGNGPLAGGS